MKKKISLFFIYLLVFLSFSSWQTQEVLAVEEQQACCEQTSSGEFCQYTGISQCNSSKKNSFTTCEQTDYCQVGCCINVDEGQCSPNVGKTECQAKGGTFDASPFCEVPQCQKGGCQLGNECFFVTQTKCKQIAS